MSRYHPLLLRAAFKHLDILADYRRKGLSKKRPFEELGRMSPTHFVGNERFDTTASTQAVLLDPVTTASKAERVMRALVDHGLAASDISIPRPATRLERAQTHMRAFCYDRALQTKNLKNYQRAFLIASLVYRDIFRGTQGMTLHIGDLSERRVAMTLGAAMAGIPAVHWQLYQHFRSIPKLGYTHAIVLSEPAAVSAEKQGISAYRQKVPAPAPIQLPSRIKSIGICLNAFGTPEQVTTLHDTLLAELPIEKVLLRPHPRIAAFDSTNLKSTVTLRPHGESLTDFASACDIVICGNSSVQTELLSLGCPVIHVPGLDSQPYDYLGLCARGTTYGMQSLQPIDISAINAFYSNTDWPDRLLATLEPPSPALPLLDSFWRKT